MIVELLSILNTIYFVFIIANDHNGAYGFKNKIVIKSLCKKSMFCSVSTPIFLTLTVFSYFINKFTQLISLFLIVIQFVFYFYTMLLACLCKFNENKIIEEFQKKKVSHKEIQNLKTVIYYGGIYFQNGIFTLLGLSILGFINYNYSLGFEDLLRFNYFNKIFV